MNRLLSLAGLVALTIAAVFLMRAERPVPADAARPEIGHPATTRASVAPLAALDDVEEAAQTVRYRMTYAATWGSDGDQTQIEISGRWDQQPQPDGTIRVVLGDVQATAHASLPAAADLAGPLALLTEDGALTGIAVTPDADELTRRTLAALATTFWARRDLGERRTEEDLTGRYTARYTREAAVLTKTIERYVALRGPRGLSAAGADTLRPSGAARFTFDAAGLVRADVDTTLTSIVNQKDALTVRITGRLVREDADLDPLAAADLRANRFADLVDYQGLDAAIDAELVGAKDLRDLLAELDRPAALDRSTKPGRAARSLLLRRLSALMRLDPAAAGRVAAAIRARAAAGEPTGLLVGAMSSADTAIATDALADLVGQVEGETAREVLNGLNLAGAATEHSLEVLGDALDSDDERAAALALGSQAKTLADAAPEAAKTAIEQLLEGLAMAQTPAEKAVYVRALGNTGDRQALPALSAIAQGDPNLAGLALFALRFMPGDDVDALLEPHVHAVGLHFDAVVAAISHRDAGRWTRPLTALRDALQSMDAPPAQPLNAVNTVLARWAS